MSNNHQHIIPEEFRDIAPFSDTEFKQKMALLVREDGFEHAVRYIMPDVDYNAFVEQLLKVDNRNEFQSGVMGPFLEMLAARTTQGITMDGTENLKPDKAYTFITNHRDIVLDASFLNLCFIRHNLPLTQVAIGNNLLIYEWITDLVKLNGSFIVKRDVRMAKALEAARHLSEYIHYSLTTMRESVWIAQREGRAKDSNDLTQESLIKMLALAGGGDTRHNLMEVNLTPVAISYEYDPNDYLKAREFLMRRRDPEFKKSQRDDLFSMETGILRPKGHVHFRVGKCINPLLASCDCDDRASTVREACQAVDRTIHCGYHIYPGNYIALDQIEGNNANADHYTAADVDTFNAYIDSQLDKVDLPDVTADERAYMRSLMLTMYANPLINQRRATGC